MSFHAKIEKPRGHRRAHVFMSGMLSTPIGPISVVIRDVSKRGALVVGDNNIPDGCSVCLLRAGSEVHAQVMWAKGKAAGLSFDRPLTATELKRWVPSAVVQSLDPDED